LQEGFTISAIARKIGRQRSTIRDEITRNSINGRYEADLAHELAISRKIEQRSKVRTIDQALKNRVDECLKKLWSPEQISGALKLEGLQVSHEWIYQYIYRDKRQGGERYKFLRRSGKKYKKRASEAGRGCIKDRVDIDQRPSIVEEKSRVGDWEGDLVLGSHGSGAVVSLVERKTKLSKFRRINHKTAAQTNLAIVDAFKSITAGMLLTLTFDNGKEFAWHKHITNALGVDIYFAKPYHSWERGLNENTNGLLRQYLPKGSSFADLTTEELLWIEDQLNDRPRKSLGYKTPRQAMEMALAG
jgi:IS30 family transposase